MSTTPAKPNQVDSSGKHVAANVRRLRDTLGWSTYEVSAMLKKAGRPIAASSITNIEAGRRRVDADDLVALAVVFGVNPSALLFPLDETGSIELTGGGTVAAKTVWEWADGERPLRTDGDEAALAEQWGRFLRLARPASRRQIGLSRIRSQLVPALETIVDAEKFGSYADAEADRAEEAGGPDDIELAVNLLKASNQYSREAIANAEEAVRQFADMDAELSPVQLARALVKALEEGESR